MTLSFPVFFFCSLVIIGGRAGRLRPYSPAIFGVLGIYFLGIVVGRGGAVGGVPVGSIT